MKKFLSIGSAFFALFLVGCSSDNAPSMEDGMSDAQKAFIEAVGCDNSKVLFAFDSSKVDASEAKKMDAVAEWLSKNPNSKVIIEGHCDERGTAVYNMGLGKRRAEAVKAYLVAKKTGASISTVSYGKERPEVAESNPAAWDKNRRGVVVIAN